MATKVKRRRGEKTQAVLAFLKQNRNASAAEVMAGLKKQGINVSIASIYNIRSKSSRRGRRSRSGLHVL